MFRCDGPSHDLNYIRIKYALREDTAISPYDFEQLQRSCGVKSYEVVDGGVKIMTLGGAGYVLYPHCAHDLEVVLMHLKITKSFDDCQ